MVRINSKERIIWMDKILVAFSSSNVGDWQSKRLRNPRQRQRNTPSAGRRASSSSRACLQVKTGIGIEVGGCDALHHLEFKFCRHESSP